MRCAIVLAILLAGQSAAGSPHDDYEGFWERAQALSKAHDWAGARAQLEAAFAIEQRPIVLFSIGSTYWHQGDRANTRRYYRRYLEVADDPAVAEVARLRLAELDRTEPAVLAPYPSAVIDRPLTLLGGVLAPGAGAAVSPRYTPSMTGGVTTSYTPLALAAASYGISDTLEIAGELDIGAHDAFGAVRGTLSLARSAAIAAEVTTHDTGFYDVRLGALLRVKLAEHLAMIADEEQLLVSSDATALRLPLGAAYQFTSRIYAWAATRLAVSDLHSVTLLGADYRYAAFGVTLVPRDDLDIVVTARTFDAGGDGSVFVRLRL